MSNLGNYSPYNKTYKFICFQNQAYHQKNKRNCSPVVKTNLRYSRRLPKTNLPINPQYPQLLKNLSQHQTSECQSPTTTYRAKSMIFEHKSPNTMRNSAIIDKQKRVVHKNQSFQKFRSKIICKENAQLVNRLLEASCQVIKNKKSQESFNKHLKYRNIRKIYHQHGSRKQVLSLGNSSLLCPTLSEFHKTGLGPKFLQKDLSMCSGRSGTASPIISPRKMAISTPL